MVFTPYGNDPVPSIVERERESILLQPTVSDCLKSDEISDEKLHFSTRTASYLISIYNILGRLSMKVFLCTHTSASLEL
jgi:hypothetical protein